MSAEPPVWDCLIVLISPKIVSMSENIKHSALYVKKKDSLVVSQFEILTGER